MDILRNPTSEQIITAIEQNLFAWIPILGKMGSAVDNDPIGVKRVKCDRPTALFNSVMDAQLHPGQVESTITHIQSDARQRKVPLLWWISPSTRPADVEQHLIDHGFVIDEASPGMAVDLTQLNENLRLPEGLTVQLAQDDASFRVWTTALAAGFEFPPSLKHVEDTWYDFLRLTDVEIIQAYTGLLNRKPVATSLLFLAAGVAGIYAVGTAPEVRRKGIGTWMTFYPLLQARRRGYNYGVIEASEMGESVYRSLGFQEYCRINSYRWRP